MTSSLPVEVALQIADKALFSSTAKHLTNIELIVLEGALQGKKYQEIAAESGYNPEYLKNNVGPKLWKLLSESLGDKVNKNNVVAVLTQQAASNLGGRNPIATTSHSPFSIKQASPKIALESPHSLVPPTSAFYIKRPPLEETCYQKLEEPGALARIKAPSQMGKTSLMLACLAYARKQRFRTVVLNFQQADSSVFISLEKFLHWFCTTLNRKLELPHQVNDYWLKDYGSKSNCTTYLEDCLLSEQNTSILLALDQVNELFFYPEIAKDFFSLLRSWHEEAAYGAPSSGLWQKLRLLIIHSTEVYIPLETNKSPFNVGLAIDLPYFTLEQVEDLSERHGLYLPQGKLEQLMYLLAGHPYLVRQALYHVAREQTSWEELVRIAATDAGIYRQHLYKHLGNLQQQARLRIAYEQVVRSTVPVQLEQMLAFQLHSLGLVNICGNAVKPSCELYRQYFRERLSC
ncbi:MAG: AAA-like domain-containing protein [Coleofasciculaceae cyanobacterium]